MWMLPSAAGRPRSAGGAWKTPSRGLQRTAICIVCERASEKECTCVEVEEESRSTVTSPATWRGALERCIRELHWKETLERLTRPAIAAEPHKGRVGSDLGVWLEVRVQLHGLVREICHLRPVPYPVTPRRARDGGLRLQWGGAVGGMVREGGVASGLHGSGARGTSESHRGGERNSHSVG